MVYNLSDVIVSGVGVVGVAEGDLPVPSETVTFSYGKIEWTYTEFQGDTRIGDVKASWDVTYNRNAQTAEGTDLSESALAAAESPPELQHQQYADGGLQALQAALASGFDAFLKIDGIPGESTDNQHKQWIEVLSYSHGVSQPSTGGTSAGGGRSGERCDHKDFTLLHALDKASPSLALYCSSGRPVSTVTVELSRGGQRFMQYQLSNVIVSSVHTGGSASADALPLEEVSFNYGKIQWTYTEFRGETRVGDIRTYWDRALSRGGQTAEAADLSEPVLAAAAAPADLCCQQYADRGLQALQAALASGFNAFLKIDGVPGESTDNQHKAWIEVLSYSHGMSRSSTGGTPAGGARCDHDDFSLVHALDKASPTLALYCCKTQHISTVTVELCRTGGDKETFMRYKLSDVIVTGVQPGGTAQGGESLPLEEVTFNYGKIEWTYGTVKTYWDLTLTRGGQEAEPADFSEPALAAAEAPTGLWQHQEVFGGRQALEALASGFDAFLKIDGIPGESKDDKHKEWIEIVSYSHGVSRPGAGSRSSAGARCEHEDFSIVHVLDKASPTLALSCCQGKRIPTVTLELWRDVDADGGNEEFMQYKLSDVIVSSIHVSGSAAGEPRPAETVTFNYGKIEWTYTKYDGGIGTDFKASWDRVANRGAATAEGGVYDGVVHLPADSREGDGDVSVPAVPTAATAATSTAGSTRLLAQEAVAPLLSQAVDYWVTSGVPSNALSGVQVIVEPLQPGYLGFGSGNEKTIWIDDDAAGYGWFADPTPADNSEFNAWTSDGGLLMGYRARYDGPAAGRMDLLSVVVHELGHVLGLGHTSPFSQPGSVMLGSLPRGLRRLPAEADLFGLDPETETVAMEQGPPAPDVQSAASLPTDGSPGGGAGDPASLSPGDPTIRVELVAVASPTLSGETATLPESLTEIPLGGDFCVEIWVQGCDQGPAGITGGQVDLAYTTGGVNVVGLAEHGDLFDLFTGGSADAEPGRIDDFGGGTLAGGIAAQPNWARLGWTEFSAANVGWLAFQSLPGNLPFSRFGAGNLDWSAVDLGGITLTVTSPVEPLGEITFLELPDLDPSQGELWYSLQTTHTGFLTLEGRFTGPLENVRLSLYDDPGADAPLAESLPMAGSQRIDWPTDAGSRYYLRVTGTAMHVDLRLVNLVQRAGGTVTVWGTEEEDRLEFRAEAPRTITINDVRYEFSPAEVSRVTFDGGGGGDAALVYGSSRTDTAVIDAASAHFTGFGFSLSVTSVAQIAFCGTDGIDALSLVGSPGADTFVLGAGSAAVGSLTVRFCHVEQLTLDGGTGDDTYRVSALSTNTTISDIAGTDWLDFSQAAVGVNVSLASVSAQQIFAPTNLHTLTIKGTIENVIGSPKNDVIRGNIAVNRIEGRGGDDWLYGDAGDDWLYGGAGNNMLQGGAGKDHLDVLMDADALGRNLLIGGADADTLQGGPGEEILIGGTTTYDNNAAALAAIMKEWSSTKTFDERRRSLDMGFTGANKAGWIQLKLRTREYSKGTILDDKAIDVLYGVLGNDWFFAFPGDDVHDGSSDER